ncbi:MAG: glycoside hydrolase family 3 C-terminal domain-containing protein [Alphaproteobacteria bacterium]|nr:glycoside hydrolase family 3 C-terminal domain-containing protein [Alphaproteobacteria bacterium]
MNWSGKISLAVAAFASLVLASCSTPPVSTTRNGSAPVAAPPPYMNPDLPIAQRVDDLVSRMTLEEKASQLVNEARAIPRLGIPAYNWWSEALHGVARNGVATVFPEPIGLGATFDPALVHSMAVDISTEARVKYEMAIAAGRHDIYQGLDFWSPNINIFRDPRWGRGQETYGEDPYLTGRMGYAFVTGMQGDNPKYYRTIATPKHFAVHSGPEPTRHEADVKVSKHDEEDTYLPAFREAIVDAKADSIMCAYNAINGQPACANDFLLTDTLRGAWDFKGYMVSDCDAIADIDGGLSMFTTGGHHYVKTLAEAAAVSMKHGVDNDCADFSQSRLDNDDYQRYVDAVREGLLPESVMDASLKRLFTARMKLGLFDPPGMVPYANTPESELDSPAHRELALKAARESIVLLKNNGVLPLKPGVRRIAVVGPLADVKTVLYGNYNGFPSRTVTALDGIRAAFPNAKVTFEPGTNFLRPVEPVETSYLTADDGKPGLTAAFFTTADFSGTPVLSRVDPGVVYDFDRKIELPAAPKFAVRWTGTLTPTQTGPYLIGLDSRSGRLWVDGKLIVDITVPRQRAPKTVQINLEAGHKYAVRIERDLAPGPLAIKFVWGALTDNPLPRAVAAAQHADVVVAVVGITSQLEGEEMNVDVPGFKGGDRTSLKLPAAEEAVLQAVKKTGKPLVVVLMNGSALAVNWSAKNASAIMDAWYSGEEGGTAIGETLSGANNPAGRLPVTFYTGTRQLPPFDDYAMKGRTYRYFTGKPLYPFGYGLSYTSFAYSGLKLSTDKLQAGEPLGVDVEVRNTGKRAGDEVAELYLAFPKIPGTPIRALRGMQRVHLVPGETQHLHFDLKPRDLSSVTEAGDIEVQPGDYALSIGGGQRGTTKAIVATGFTIEGGKKLPY